jgi:predicted secreted protein
MNLRVIAACMVLLLAGAFLVAGCMETPPQTFEFDESNNGATAEVVVGSEIKLSLDENPTTGYTWNMTINGLEVVNDEYLPSDTSGTMVGSGGTHVWYLKANEAGTATISGIYMRQWEEITGNETTFDMTVIIR